MKSRRSFNLSMIVFNQEENVNAARDALKNGKRAFRVLMRIVFSRPGQERQV